MSQIAGPLQKVKSRILLALKNYPLKMVLNVFKSANKGTMLETNAFQFEFVGNYCIFPYKVKNSQKGLRLWEWGSSNINLKAYGDLFV